MTKLTEQALRELVNANPDLQRLNPDYGKKEEKRRGKTEAHKQWERAQREALENRFVDLWALQGGAPLERQFAFHPERKFRADFYHAPSKSLIEIDGGLWTGGAHNHASTYGYQQERDRLARALGYEVYRLGTGFTEEDVRRVRTLINERESDNA